jgi:hypothetical protein
MPWEASGQYASGTTFIEGLVLFQNKWFLYYGCADTFVGVTIANVKPGETTPMDLNADNVTPHQPQAIVSISIH